MIFIAALGCATVESARCEDAPKKLPVPPAAERQAAEKVVREIYADDLAKLTPETRPALIQRMLAQATETKDDAAGRYTLMAEAADIAAQGGELDLFMSLRDKLAGEFAIPKEFTLGGLITLTAESKNNPALAKAVVAEKTLLEKPNDAAANLAAGRYALLVKGDAERGAELLAKSGHPILKVVAAQEKSKPTAAPDQVALGDLWWNFYENGAEKEDKLPAQQRAIFWYKQALPSLAGLTKLKVEKRVASVEPAAPPAKASAEAAKPAEVKPESPQQKAEAKKPGNFVESSLDLGENVKLDLVQVKAGQFKMGSEDAEAHVYERPVRVITITKNYWIGKYSVTVAQFRRFIDETKYKTDAEKSGRGSTPVNHKFSWSPGATWSNPGFSQEDTHPVVMVSWNDAQAFCAWLSKKTKRQVRLPTEAEWEYACRGPQALKYPWGNSWDGSKANHADQALKNAAVFFDNDVYSDNDDGYVYTSPAGAFENASWCGAYDMAGNCKNWVFNWYSKAFRFTGTTVDPAGPPEGEKMKFDGLEQTSRVLKGSAWSDSAKNLRGSVFHNSLPELPQSSIGFRIVVQP
ncbi:MAG TPA: formylglycine-generating enzyme family protein [Planctomycetota bacterium]|nr:formylglycine-generating enzyme family protein [Planctomycetota bacterium]